MDVSPILGRSISVRFEKNDLPPPHNIIKVVDATTDELIRQIPSEEKKQPENLDSKLPEKEFSVYA